MNVERCHFIDDDVCQSAVYFPEHRDHCRQLTQDFTLHLVHDDQPWCPCFYCNQYPEPPMPIPLARGWRDWWWRITGQGR